MRRQANECCDVLCFQKYFWLSLRIPSRLIIVCVATTITFTKKKLIISCVEIRSKPMAILLYDLYFLVRENILFDSSGLFLFLPRLYLLVVVDLWNGMWSLHDDSYVAFEKRQISV